MALSSHVMMNSVSTPPQISSKVLSSSNSSFFSTSSRLKPLNLVLVEKNRSSKNKSGGLTCVSMFGLGVPELVVIAGVATLVFGPKKLPEVGKSIGKTFKSFQQAAKEFETELRKEEPESLQDSKPVAIEITDQENKDVNNSQVSL